MFGTHDLWLFVVSGLLLNITPGPDTLYIVGRSSTGARS
jgi:threonine/homoserine/homoserine lactone efflux protein